jgi:hypothetical protein
MLTRDELRGFIKAVDPGRPLQPGDSAYVALDEGTPVRGTGGGACIDKLEQTIVLGDATGTTCQLFSGFPGAGKTTELLRLKKRLEQDKTTGTHVVLVDAMEYVDPYTPFTITDALRVFAFTLDREAIVEEAIAAHREPDLGRGYLRRLFDFLTQTDVELNKLGFDYAGIKLMADLKDNKDFRRRAEQALSLRFQQFASEAKEVMEAAVVRLRTATGAQRIVLIADGLEKLLPLREEDRIAVEASAETVFAQQPSFLRPPCHAILTFPLWLRFRASAALGAAYSREPEVLPMVKVVEPQDGRAYSPGIDKLLDLVGRRIDVARVFGGSATLGELVRASGGYPKDLLRMVREVLYQTSAFPAQSADVTRVIDRLAESYGLELRGSDLDLLTEVAATHAVPVGDGATVAKFGRLLEHWFVLAYRNGSEWYDVHPLVRRSELMRKRLART